MMSHPWPLSELTHEEAEQMLALPPKIREGRIATLKREIANGTHAKRKLMREREGSQ